MATRSSISNSSDADDRIVTVRPLGVNEERTFLEIHTRSVRGLAAPHYPAEVIDAWTLPITDKTLAELSQNPDGEIRLIAELDGEPVALGVLVVSNEELRACYVVPEAARKGVGTALVSEIERIARQHGLRRLELFASINAEPFYTSLGYRSNGRTEFVLRTGQPMSAVKMEKELRDADADV